MINWGQLGLLLGVGAINARKVYDQLSPESKAKLADIVRWGVRQAASYALNNVLGDVGNQVINQVINDPKVADVAKTLVKRGIEVGVEKALSEANLS